MAPFFYILLSEYTLGFSKVYKILKIENKLPSKNKPSKKSIKIGKMVFKKEYLLILVLKNRAIYEYSESLKELVNVIN